MKKHVLILFTLLLGFVACKNAYEKEIGEVEGLITMVDELEKAVLSVDTSKAFAAKRKMAMDIKAIDNLNDTLDRETAFRLDELFKDKKVIFRFNTNYTSILDQIEYTKKQLADLKQDLNNGLITKEEFDTYYAIEHSSIMDLNTQINKSVAGVEEAVQAYELFKGDIDKLINDLSEESADNE